MTIIGKRQRIYELFEKTVYLVYDEAEGPVSEFIGGHLARDPQLTWTELEGLLVGEYADEGTAVEAMRSLMKHAHVKDESPGELGTRAMKLSTLVFPEEIRKDTTVQAQQTCM